MALKQSFKVRDFRNKGFFMVDDAYLNGYAKILGTTTSMVYFAICRSADKEQIAFPSQDYIAEKLGVHRVTINRHVKKLIEWNIIRIEKIRNHKGKFLHNTYFLLDKSEWQNHHVTPPLHGQTHVTPVHDSMYHQSYNKGTHNKGTHSLSTVNKKYSSLKDVGKEEFLKISEDYQFPLAFVESKYDDMVNWHESSGKEKKNWYATLRNWVKRDGIQLRKEGNLNGSKRAIDASNL